MKPYVWVVEMWDDQRADWLPTTGTALTRAEGRAMLREWRKHNPDDWFRLARYRRMVRP